MTSGSGAELGYEIFGEMAIGKIMWRELITSDSEAFEGDALSDVIVNGTVMLTIT